MTIKKVKSILILLILLALVISGIGTGIGSFTDIFDNKEKKGIIGTVGSEEVTINEFNDVYTRKIEYVSQFLGGRLTSQQVANLNIAKMALEELIDLKLVDNLVIDLKLDLGKESVADFIRIKGLFRNADGEFDREAFHNTLRQNNLTEKSFSEYVKRDILRNMVVQSLQARPQMSEHLLDKLYNVKYKPKITDIITVFLPDANSLKTPSEEDLHNLYDIQGHNILTPEYRRGNYISICLNDIELEKSITSQEIESVLHGKDYSDLLERRNFINLIINNHEEAIKVQKSMDQGKDSTEKVIKSYQNQSNGKVKLENISKYDLQTELRNTVFSMKTGETAVVKTPLGWHVIKMEKIYKASSNEIEKIRQGIHDQLLLERKVKSLHDLISNMENDIVNNASTVSDLASKYNLDFRNLDYIDIHGNDIQGELIPVSAELRDNITKLMFSRELHHQDVFSTNTAGTCYMNVYVKDIRKSEHMDFHVAVPILKEMWNSQKRKEIGMNQAREILAKIKSNDTTDIENMSNVTVEKNITIYRNSVFSEVNPKQQLPVKFVDAIFSTQDGESTNIIESESKILIGMVAKNGSSPEIKENAILYRRFKKKFTDLHDAVFREQIMKYLRNIYDVNIDPEFFIRVGISPSYPNQDTSS